MSKQTPTPYIIGIDLGTTNCAVSYVDRRKDPKNRKIRQYQIPQLSGAGELTRQPVLPSFLYLPGQYEISQDAIKLPWATQEDDFAGLFARDHGEKVPGRLVASAKSWLCHENVDRVAPILPWGSDAQDKRSPVVATAAYLKHIKKAWNHAQNDDSELFLENQFVTITVPASFDEVARELTLEAAKLAGLTTVTLLEEPLAAFYSWLISHEKSWQDHVAPGELILVCDVGGGTTDFSLISLRDVDGSPRFERLAVGNHLILGGDNIDLALARLVEQKIGKKDLSLSTDRWKSLCHLCRRAKETILDQGKEEERITMVGSGSQLIGGTVSTALTRADLEQLVVNGFFPLVDSGKKKNIMARKGITEFGLPYEQEPAITQHLGWFLEEHQDDVARLLDKPPIPDYVLFNGGSLKPAIIQERILDAITSWFGLPEEQRPKVLPNPEPDLAVSLGASYYGLVKAGDGVRVGSGSPRSYYLGVQAHTSGDDKQAICVVERGLDEGSSIDLSGKKFEVKANQPVSFDIFSSSFRAGDRSGDLLSVDHSLTPLPPIQTVVNFGKKGDSRHIPVHIEVEYTELGTLRLWCKSEISDHRWQLNFQLRQSDEIHEPIETGVADEGIVEASKEAICFAFAQKPDDAALTRIARKIEEIQELPKDKWPLAMIRPLADALIELSDERKKSPAHESRWLNLLGFCLRPGYGDAFDEHRQKALWKLFKEGRCFPKNPQVASDWWVFWRRLAGGLKPGHQRQFFQDISPLLIPKKGVKVGLSLQEEREVWMAMANMERLSPKDKTRLGNALLQQINPKKVKPYHLWALSRLGARQLLYGPADRVVPPDVAWKWIDALMKKKWADPTVAIYGMVQVARKTGDRVRDLTEEQYSALESWLSSKQTSKKLMQMIHEVVDLDVSEGKQVFGESLPSGLVLVHDDDSS